jgi:hypothetical protein
MIRVTGHAQQICIMEERTRMLSYRKTILKSNFEPIFIRVGTKTISWIFSVKQAVRFECKCHSDKTCVTKNIIAEGAGTFQHPENCELIAEHYTLRSTGYFESKLTINAAEIDLPSLPALLSADERTRIQSDKKGTDLTMQELEMRVLHSTSLEGLTTQHLTREITYRSSNVTWYSWAIPTAVCTLTVVILGVIIAKWRLHWQWRIGSPTPDRRGTGNQGESPISEEDGRTMTTDNVDQPQQAEVQGRTVSSQGNPAGMTAATDERKIHI